MALCQCGLCFVEDTFVNHKYIITNFVIIVNTLAFSCWLPWLVSDCLLSPILRQSATNGMSKSMSCPKMAAPGEALSTVWWGERMTYAALSRKTLMSSGVNELAISNSAVGRICPSTWCTHSNMPIACGFLTVVGLHLIPYDLHRYSKWSLNSLPLSYIKWRHRGYLHNPVLFTNLAICYEVLSKISSAINSFLPLTVCWRSYLTTGSSAISNQLGVGAIMVRAIKSICELSLPLRVYGPMRSTHKHSQGIV